MVDDPFRILILGAGFSKPAGLPLAPELWKEIMRRARALTGRAAKLQEDLRNYIAYKHDCDGVDLDEDEVEFEDFCRFLDIEHYLGLRGSDTWSQDGNEGTVVIKTLLGEILAERTPTGGDIPGLYLQFAEGLQPHDRILTFNYDCLLENALDVVGKPYRLFPQRYSRVAEYGAQVDDSKREVVVLKFHGSIDWFDRNQYSTWERQSRETGGTERLNHPVFGPGGDDLEKRNLVDGPRFPDDPLAGIYRVHDIHELYQRRLMFMATPWLLAPSTIKIVYASRLADFWYGAGSAGALNFGMAIIGYSLPSQDDYARQAVHAMVTNYQRDYWEEGVLDKKKSPLVLVDYRQSDEEIRDFGERYRFVDWDRAVSHYGGFSEKSLGVIFS